MESVANPDVDTIRLLAWCSVVPLETGVLVLSDLRILSFRKGGIGLKRGGGAGAVGGTTAPRADQKRAEGRAALLLQARSRALTHSQNRRRKYAKPKDKEKPYFSVWSVCRAHLYGTRMVRPAAETTGQCSSCWSRVRRLRFSPGLTGI